MFQKGGVIGGRGDDGGDGEGRSGRGVCHRDTSTDLVANAGAARSVSNI